MKNPLRCAAGVAAVALLFAAAAEAGVQSNLKEGNPDVKTAGALAFGPEGVLFIGDPQSAAVFAVAVNEKGDRAKGEINVEGVNEKIAQMLGTEAGKVRINDMAVNPATGTAYLSVARGTGPDASPVIFRVGTDGKLNEFPLKKVPFAKAELPNAPAPGGEGRRNQRAQSITDLEYYEGRVFVAGLSNEEFASTLRSIPFPFKDVDKGTSVEVFHGAHGKFETRSPVRTFTTYKIEDEPHVLAAYTCTPLVKFPVSQLKAGSKVKGTTVAELGNRNRPLDMFVYKSGGKDFILMANSARGMMKISTEDLDRNEGITERIQGTAGQKYETIEDMKGVAQLDRLNDSHALVLVENEDNGRQDLRTVKLP